MKDELLIGEEEHAVARTRRLSGRSLRCWLRTMRMPPKGASLQMIRLWHELRLESYGIRRKGLNADGDL